MMETSTTSEAGSGISTPSYSTDLMELPLDDMNSIHTSDISLLRNEISSTSQELAATKKRKIREVSTDHTSDIFLTDVIQFTHCNEAAFEIELNHTLPSDIFKPFGNYLIVAASRLNLTSSEIEKLACHLRAQCYFLCAQRLYHTMSENDKISRGQFESFITLGSTRLPKQIITASLMIGNFDSILGPVKISSSQRLMKSWILTGMGWGLRNKEYIEHGTECIETYYGLKVVLFSRKICGHPFGTDCKCHGSKPRGPKQLHYPATLLETSAKTIVDEYCLKVSPILEKIFDMEPILDRAFENSGNAAQFTSSEPSTFSAYRFISDSEKLLGFMFNPCKNIILGNKKENTSHNRDFASTSFASKCFKT